MTPLTCKPSDYETLTPSHFLTEEAANLPQVPDVLNLPVNQLR